MAIVLDAFASYVQNMLREMATEEVRMLLGVPDEMEKMNVKLEDLKSFLADADRRNITETHVQGWVKDLKGAMYDCIDILDLCQLKAMKGGLSEDMGCLNPLLFCLRNPLHAHDIGRRLKKLNEKLDGIRERSEQFNFINLSSYQDRGRMIESSRIPSRETTGEPELDVVGDKIKEDTRMIVDLLTTCKKKAINEEKKVMVFAIVGVGGIGKTTLAKSVFSNEIILQQFDKKIWLSVNQDYTDIKLLVRIIEAGKGQVTSRTNVALEETLKEMVKDCRTLLVMDDVWNGEAWTHVLKTPFTNASAHGSCVLVTTRGNHVARGMMAMEPYHHINRLDPEDAWSLLKKQVVRNESEDSQVDMLKDIGMKIAAKCDGLPLAIKVMGGLLRQKKTRRSDWENVLNDSVWSVSQMPKELNNAIYLSYQDLHPSLKPCLLHFSLLPKSTMFYDDDIVGMWISEGFVHGGSRDLEELGREYYEELILRNLIEPNINYVDEQICNMHDVIRSFAQYVARDEALVAHSSMIEISDKLNSQKFIRLSLETKGPEPKELEWMYLQPHVSLRTLISVGPIKINPSDSLVMFSSIRTLLVQDANFDTLAASLIQLKHLRYLSIKNTNTSMLPEDIGKMKFLQHISLLSCKSLLKLPGSIGQLGQLRFLKLTGTRINNVPKGFNGLISLRKLYGFPAHMDAEWCSLDELGPLSKLTELHINGIENISSSSLARKTRLFEKAHLRYLKLSCTSRHGDDGSLLKENETALNKGQQQIEEVFDELCPPSCLERLVINGYVGRTLPRWMVLPSIVPLGSLRVLMIKDMPFCTEVSHSLCQLPCLEFLQIEGAPAINCVGPGLLQPHNHERPSALQNLCFVIKLHVTICAGLERIRNLPKMQEVSIVDCPKLKVLEGTPALRRLFLIDYNMETLPGYLQDVNPKHLLEIKCNMSLLTSMAAGKSSLEWDKFSHIKQVKAYADDKEKKVERKWYVMYTRDPFSFKTNIMPSANAPGNSVE